MSTKGAQSSSARPKGIKEQFIPDHLFVYVDKGAITCYDGNKSYTLRQGEYGLVRKNRLAKYYSEKGTSFNRIMFCFDETFLRGFQEKYKPALTAFNQSDTVVKITPNEMISAFIHSLAPYTNAGMLNAAFEDIKYDELLMILLQNQPDLAGLFFNYAKPEKINLEEYMNSNYKFNVSTERFAYMTGRSLSAFKRDFTAIFKQAPNRWLVERRLREAYVLIAQEQKTASEIYLELGFEDLSHFSLAFKKLFGLRPTELAAQQSDNASKIIK
jgi:AraC-like DNA-binding protein